MDNKPERDPRLDLAKAIAISLVLLWHLQPLQLNVTGESAFSIKLLKFLVEQFNYQITLLAVPLFLLVSIFLFFGKMQGQVADYSRKRLLRIFEIFLFWTTFQTLGYLLIRSLPTIQSTDLVIRFPSTVFEILTLGGLGGSVFYFLFVLLGLQIMASVYGVFWEKQRILTIISILWIIVSVFYFEYKNITYAHLPYWRIDNFLVYVPIAYLLRRIENKKLLYFIPVLFLGYSLFSAYDLYLGRIGPDPGIYGRLSISLGATALFSAILQLRSLKENKIILFLSSYSLGIYAVHNYWQKLFIYVFRTLGLSSGELSASFVVNVWNLIIFVLVIALTALTILLLRKTPLKRFIM